MKYLQPLLAVIYYSHSDASAHGVNYDPGLHTAHPLTLTLTLRTLIHSLESFRTLFLFQGSSQPPSFASPLLALSACNFFFFFFTVLHNLVIVTTLCSCFYAAILPVFTTTTVTWWPEEPMLSHLHSSLTNTVFKFLFTSWGHMSKPR